MNNKLRLCSALLALSLLLTLTACGGGSAVPEAAETSAPAETAAPTPEPTAPPEPGEVDKTPVLSVGAAPDAALSGLFQTGADGTIYTSIVRADGLVYLPDILPEELGYIAGFLLGEGGFYIACKDSVYSLEPASLYFFSDAGETRLITADLHPGGLFCLSGGALFFKTYEDSGLWRLGAGEDEPRRVIDGDASLLGADSGFIFYARDGAVCRNDSTMGAEIPLFDDTGVTRLFAAADGLCDVTYSGDGAAQLEFRAPDSELRGSFPLPQNGDSALLRDGRVYAVGDGVLQVFSLADGTALDPLPLPEGQSYLTLHGVAGDSLYYEAFDGEGFRAWRLPLAGGEPEDLGPSLLY